MIRGKWLILPALLGSLWLLYEIAEMSIKLGMVPTKFGLTLPYFEGNCGDWLSYAGAFVVGLNSSTIAGIERDGIEWFADVGGPRRGKRGPFYKNWQLTPLPDRTWSEGIPRALDCAQRRAGFWPRAIIPALKAGGGYYSKWGSASVYVLPDLGLLVMSLEAD